MKTLAAIMLSLLLAGCVTQEVVRSGEQVQPAQTVREGVVDAARDVQIEAPRTTGVGSVIGAVLGGVAGSYIGSGNGTIVGSVIGSMLGGIAGNAAEQAGARQPGVELTIRLDEGSTIIVAQPVADVLFRPGDRVQVISDGINARVTR